jgi:hypothetical protein
MGRTPDINCKFGTTIFVACLLVIAMFVVLAVFGKARAQSAAPSYQVQLKALTELIVATGIKPGLKYKAGGVTYNVKEINISIAKDGSHIIEIKSEVAK